MRADGCVVWRRVWMEGLVEVRADHEVCCLEACLDGGTYMER